MGCSTIDDWHNQSKFSEWYLLHEYRFDGWEIDKDILLKGNKIYSPENCCFVPAEINCMFVKNNAIIYSAMA